MTRNHEIGVCKICTQEGEFINTGFLSLPTVNMGWEGAQQVGAQVLYVGGPGLLPILHSPPAPPGISLSTKMGVTLKGCQVRLVPFLPPFPYPIQYRSPAPSAGTAQGWQPFCSKQGGSPESLTLEAESRLPSAVVSPACCGFQQHLRECGCCAWLVAGVRNGARLPHPQGWAGHSLPGHYLPTQSTLAMGQGHDCRHRERGAQGTGPLRRASLALCQGRSNSGDRGCGPGRLVSKPPLCWFTPGSQEA